MIKERTPTYSIAKRPAKAVPHATGTMLGGINLPQFLNAEAVLLDVAILVEIEAANGSLGERPPYAFGQKHIAGAQHHARLIGGAW